MRKTLDIIVKGVVLFMVMAIIVVLFVAHDYSSSSTTSSSSSAGQKIYKWRTWDGESEIPTNAKVVVYLGEIERSAYGSTATVHGLARNMTSESFNYIQVSIGIYVNDVKHGSCFANETNLSSGTTWEFSGLCTNVPSSAFKYRVDNVTFY